MSDDPKRPLTHPGETPGRYRTGEEPLVGDTVDGYDDGSSLATVRAIDSDELEVSGPRVPWMSQREWETLSFSRWRASCCCLVRRWSEVDVQAKVLVEAGLSPEASTVLRVIVAREKGTPWRPTPLGDSVHGQHVRVLLGDWRTALQGLVHDGLVLGKPQVQDGFIATDLGKAVSEKEIYLPLLWSV